MRNPPHTKSPLYPGWAAKQQMDAYEKWCDKNYALLREVFSRAFDFKTSLGLPPKIRIRCKDWAEKKPRNEQFNGFDPKIKYTEDLLARITAARISAEKVIADAGGVIVDSRENKIVAKTPMGDDFIIFVA